MVKARLRAVALSRVGEGTEENLACNDRRLLNDIL